MPTDTRLLGLKLQLQQQEEKAWTDVPDLLLDPASSFAPIPLAAGEVSFGPIYVQQGSGSREGKHSLRISPVDGHKLGLAPFRIPFDLLNASATSTALQAASDELNTATATVTRLTKQLRQHQLPVTQQRDALRSKVLSARKHIPDHLQLDTGNVSVTLQTCQQSFAELPNQRQPGHPAWPTEEQRQQLLATKGVLGFLSDLVLVSDDDDARLLSFRAGSRLQVLVVTDWEARLAVRAAVEHSRYKPSMLVLTLANRLPGLDIPAVGEL